MRLLELRLLNFRQHADTRISFPTGLTGIIGPNGAGKSTLLEAIGWAIYGADATRGTNDTLRHSRAGAGARVEAELRFLLAEREYRVVRTLTSAAVWVDGSPGTGSSSVGGATEFLQRQLGMARREFFNTYFTGQKELQFLASMGPTERGRFLATVLGYDRLRLAQGLARQKRNQLRSRVEGLRAGLPDEASVRAARAASVLEVEGAREIAGRTADELREARRSLEQVAPRWEEVRRARERHAQVAAELTAARGDREAAEREIARIGEELARIRTAEEERARLTEDLAALPDLLRQTERLDALARTHERRRALAEQVRDLGMEMERSMERLHRLEQAPELLRRYSGELLEAASEREQVERELEARKTAWLRDRQDAETKLQSYRDRAVELQEEVRRIREAGQDGLCPTCRRPLGDDFQQLLATLEEQSAEVTQDGKWWRSRHEQLAVRPTEVAELEARLEEIVVRVEDRSRKQARCEAALQELEALRGERDARAGRRERLRSELEELPAGYDAGEHERAAAAVAKLRDTERRAAALEEVTRRGEEWKGARAAAEARLRAATQAEEAARSVVAALDFSAAAADELRGRVEEAERTARLAEVAAAEAQERLRGAERAAEAALTAERALDARIAEIEAVATEFRHHGELDAALTRMRSDLNARVRPELAEIASQLMAQLTDGRYNTLEIDEAYRVLVLEDGVSKPVISGGEEDVANLVLRISLSRMIAERAGHPLSLLVLDEVFGSLDAVRRENVVRLLRRLGDRFEQVLLVTHLEEIRGAMDQVLRVDLDERTGSSIVRWEGAELRAEAS